jgi:hypothetical protein
MIQNYIAFLRERSYCLLRDAQLTSRRKNIVGGCVVSRDVVHGDHRSPNNTSIHNILSNAPQLSISHKALGSLPENGNITPKHVVVNIHN